MNATGPLEFLVVTFPGTRLPERVAAALRRIEVDSDVRIVDALVVVRPHGGGVHSAEFADVPGLAAIAADHGLGEPGAQLIDAQDIAEVGHLLAPPSMALALLIEHAWARETAEAVFDIGGALMASVRILDSVEAQPTTSR